MRVLMTHDVPLPGLGGAERYVARLADGLRAAGDSVVVVTPSMPHVGARRVLDLWDPWARQLVAREAARFRPDVVHHHNVVRELSVSVLGVPAGVPQVLTLHDVRLLGLADGELRGLRRAVDRLVKARTDRAVARRRLDATMAVSADLARRAVDAGFPQVTAVPALVAVPSAPSAPVTATRDVLYAGRLAATKGVPVLMSAFARVRATCPDARLLVAGSGPLADELARQSPAGVRLLGWLAEPDLQRVVARVRVVAVPSQRVEGAGLIAAEAAWQGRALVTSDVEGLREIAGHTGAVVAPAGNVEALATALVRLLTDDVWAQQIAAAAAAGARRHYDPAAVIRGVRDVYASVAGIP